MNIYPIIAISVVIFILLILIIRNWAESRHRLGYKDRAVLDKILDKKSKKEIIKEKIVSNTRADSFQDSMPASHKSKQKIKFNNNVLLENIAKNIDTRHEELGEKVELPIKEGRGVIEERTNKNGRKYYFNTETRKFAKKEDFIKQQKDDHRVDVSGTEKFSINSAEIDNQNHKFAKNIVSSGEKENGRESVLSLQKDDHRVDVSGTETFSINSVEIDNQNYEMAKNIVSSEEKENGRKSVPSPPKDDHRVAVSSTKTFSINSVEIDNQKYEFGLLLLKKKKFNRAIYYFSKAIELNPTDSAPYYYRGIAKDKLNLLKDAIEDYNDAIRQKLNIVSHSSFKINNVFYKRGYCKFKLGDNSSALKDFTRYVSIDKHNPEAYYYKGILEYEAENYSVVIADLNKAIELNPNHESAYFKRGMAKEKTGDKKGCFSDLKTAIDKGNLEAYHYLKKFCN